MAGAAATPVTWKARASSIETATSPSSSRSSPRRRSPANSSSGSASTSDEPAREGTGTVRPVIRGEIVLAAARLYRESRVYMPEPQVDIALRDGCVRGDLERIVARVLVHEPDAM